MLVFLAPIFIVFEMVQLIIAERFIGIKQIRSGVHPMDSGDAKPKWIGVLWLTGILCSWIYMIALLFSLWTGLQGLVMILVSLAGFALRRTMGLRWALVLMTIEGAVRMGLMANVIIANLFLDGHYYWTTI